MCCMGAMKTKRRKRFNKSSNFTTTKHFKYCGIWIPRECDEKYAIYVHLWLVPLASNSTGTQYNKHFHWLMMIRRGRFHKIEQCTHTHTSSTSQCRMRGFSFTTLKRSFMCDLLFFAILLTYRSMLCSSTKFTGQTLGRMSFFYCQATIHNGAICFFINTFMLQYFCLMSFIKYDWNNFLLR